MRDWCSASQGFVYRPFIFTDGWKETKLFSREFLAVSSENSARYVDQLYDISLPVKNAAAKLDLHFQLSNEFLFMTDRFSMAHSIEARTPFLDPQLIEGILSVRPAQRSSRKDPKSLLKKSVGHLLPIDVLESPKRGFVLPLQRWLRTTLLKSLYEFSDPRFLIRQGIFRSDLRTKLVEPFLANQSASPQPVWTWWMFQRWWILHNAA